MNEYGIKGVLLKSKKSIYHGKGCFKWCFDNGWELVFNKDSNDKYQVDFTYNKMGTFNFCNPDYAIEHYILDMDSYWKWGNTPDDLYGSKAYDWKPTPIRQRVDPKWQKVHDFIVNIH